MTMQRDEAFQLAGELADSGFSVIVNIGIHEKFVPREACTVQVSTMRLNHKELLDLMTIALAHDLGVHLINGAPTFMGEQRRHP